MREESRNGRWTDVNVAHNPGHARVVLNADRFDENTWTTRVVPIQFLGSGARCGPASRCRENFFSGLEAEAALNTWGLSAAGEAENAGGQGEGRGAEGTGGKTPWTGGRAEGA